MHRHYSWFYLACFCSVHYISTSAASSYQLPSGEPVYHLAQDIARRDILHLSSSHAFWTKEDAEQTPSLVVGSRDMGYIEGNSSHTQAQFRHIKSFAQKDSHTFILVDTFNHCLRLLDIRGQNTSRFAGICDGRKSQSERDTHVEFSQPADIALLGDVAYVADKGNGSIYMLYFIENLDFIIQKLDLDSFSQMSSVAIGTTFQVFYTASADKIVKVNMSQGITADVIYTDTALRSTGDDVMTKLSWLNKEKTYLAIINQETGFLGMMDLTAQSNSMITICSMCHTPGTCPDIVSPVALTSRDMPNPDIVGLTIALHNSSIVTLPDVRTLIDSATPTATCPSLSSAYFTGLSTSHTGSAYKIGFSVFGAVVLLVIIVTVIVTLCRRKTSDTKNERNTNNNDGDGDDISGNGIALGSLIQDDEEEEVQFSHSACGRRRDEYETLPMDEPRRSKRNPKTKIS